jgi:uncharacterized protein
MIVISDTSVITNLLQVGQIEILPALFGAVLIPDAVFEELSAIDQQKNKLNDLVWLQKMSVSDTNAIEYLLDKLDRGESEAIILALELNADLILMDERKGRGIAQSMGLKVTGLLGILIKAKAAGLIQFVKPVVDAMIVHCGFHIKKTVYNEVLKLAGE